MKLEKSKRKKEQTKVKIIHNEKSIKKERKN